MVAFITVLCGGMWNGACNVWKHDLSNVKVNVKVGLYAVIEMLFLLFSSSFGMGMVYVV